jgi:hypothetical protein
VKKKCIAILITKEFRKYLSLESGFKKLNKVVTFPLVEKEKYFKYVYMHLQKRLKARMDKINKKTEKIIMALVLKGPSSGNGQVV